MVHYISGKKKKELRRTFYERIRINKTAVHEIARRLYPCCLGLGKTPHRNVNGPSRAVKTEETHHFPQQVQKSKHPGPFLGRNTDLIASSNTIFRFS
mmetsp:Transcript_11783/g.20484  ORF Transcript_11783/g.20484 Transcript_11783/m.20484 type:complete len:97 (+) Transcript_11783:161-451(+)